MLCALLAVNSTIPAGMDITTDFSQPNGCDILIGRGRTEGWETHETGCFLGGIGPAISNVSVQISAFQN